MKIITIYDVRTDQAGRMILGGTNDALDGESLSAIKALIGDKVRVISPGGQSEKVTEVADVDCAQSLIGKKNIFILLKEPLEDADRLVHGEIQSLS